MKTAKFYGRLEIAVVERAARAFNLSRAWNLKTVRCDRSLCSGMEGAFAGDGRGGGREGCLSQAVLGQQPPMDAWLMFMRAKKFNCVTRCDTIIIKCTIGTSDLVLMAIQSFSLDSYEDKDKSTKTGRAKSFQPISLILSPRSSI